jgi:hypothetical protein
MVLFLFLLCYKLDYPSRNEREREKTVWTVCALLSQKTYTTPILFFLAKNGRYIYHPLYSLMDKEE